MLQPEAVVMPQVVLSEDGDLVFHIGDTSQPLRTLERDEQAQQEEIAFVERCLSKNADKPGVTVRTDSDDQTYLSTSVHNHLAQYFSNTGDHGLTEFLRDVWPLLPFHLSDGIDHVFTYDLMTNHGSVGLVYPHLQRWLDAGGMTEEVATEAAEAMALPFDETVQRKVRKDARYEVRSNGQGISAHCMDIVAIDKDYQVMRAFDDSKSTYEPGNTQYGKVNWRTLTLSTLGNCACWGVDGQDRDRPALPDYDYLYEMKPHNVDFARQALSHILGMAVIARHAAAYESRADIYENAVWSPMPNRE